MQIKLLTNYFHTVIRQKDKQADILQSLQMTAIPNTSFTTLQKVIQVMKTKFGS